MISPSSRVSPASQILGTVFRTEDFLIFFSRSSSHKGADSTIVARSAMEPPSGRRARSRAAEVMRRTILECCRNVDAGRIQWESECKTTWRPLKTGTQRRRLQFAGVRAEVPAQMRGWHRRAVVISKFVELRETRPWKQAQKQKPHPCGCGFCGLDRDEALVSTINHNTRGRGA